MKKVFLLLVLNCMVVSCYAQSKSQCLGYLKKYDVPKGYLELMKNDRAGFWTKRKDYDRRVSKNLRDLEEKSKAATKAHEAMFWTNIELNKTLKNAYTVNETCSKTIDLLRKVFDLANVDFNIKFYVVPSLEFNAAAAPNGAVLINKGLIDNLPFGGLVGVIAHELNHYINKHSQQQLYAVAKKEQSNKFWAGFGAAMTGVAAGVNAYYGGMAGQSQETINKSTQNFTKLIEDIYDTSEKATLNFKFRYSREEEIESDIAAYRFLQLVGISPYYYIDVMNVISRMEGGVTKTEKHYDHPVAETRKRILQLIAEYDKSKSSQKDLKKIKTRRTMIAKKDDMYFE